MSANHNYGPPNFQPSSMPNRPRMNSHPSYIPDGYPIPHPPRQSNDYLAPAIHQRSQLEPEPLSYQPARPEHYHPVKGPLDFPPDPLPRHSLEQRYVVDDVHEPQPRTHGRHDSAASHYKTRSRASSRSLRSSGSVRERRDRDREHHHHHHEHEHEHGRDRDHHRHSEHEHEHGREHKRHRRHHKHDREPEEPLKRKDTPRPGYGSSLYALFGSIKAALKGV